MGGYLILYAYVMITSDSIVSFVYILPMLTAITLFQNGKFSLGTDHWQLPSMYFILWEKWERAGRTAALSSIMKLPWQ